MINCMFPEVSIEVSKPEGNAYCIIAIICNKLQQIGWNEEQINQVKNDLMKGGYIHLLHVAKKYITITDVNGFYDYEFEED